MMFMVTYENPRTHKGYLALWNVQNMDEPELLVTTSASPTAVKFCARYPRLVAVGDQAGLVHFVDIGRSAQQLLPNLIPGPTVLNWLRWLRFDWLGSIRVGSS